MTTEAEAEARQRAMLRKMRRIGGAHTMREWADLLDMPVRHVRYYTAKLVQAGNVTAQGYVKHNGLPVSLYGAV